jgi:transposase
MRTNEKTFRPYEPNQMYLMPPALNEWLPEGHLAHFVRDVVARLDLSAIFDAYTRDAKGPGGAAPFHPTMMTQVLLYAYCVGCPSSRKIEKRLREDVAFRVLAANETPDFRTISLFRKRHLEALKGLFTQVLQLCKRQGLVKLGAVALDGTKIKANAALDRNRTYEKLEKEKRELDALVEGLLREADTVDEEEDRLYGPDKRGDELPPELADAERRREKIEELMRDIEREAADAAAEKQTEIEARQKEEEETGQKKRGRKPEPPDDTPDPETKRNLTDPDSRIMKTRQGYVQGYNAQAVVDVDTGVIVAADVTREANDVKQLIPMLEQVKENTGAEPDKALADAGYFSEENLDGMKDKKTEPFIAVANDFKEKQRVGRRTAPRGRAPKNLTLKQRMERKLLTKKGKRTYRNRGSTVEPVFGHIKEERGLREFLLRGIDKARAEWNLICLTHNILKSWRSGNPLPEAV